MNMTNGVKKSPAVKGPVQLDNLLHGLVFFFHHHKKFIVDIKLNKMLIKKNKLMTKQI